MAQSPDDGRRDAAALQFHARYVDYVAEQVPTLKQDLQHFIQLARDQGIEVVGECLEPVMGLYAYERDSRTDLCDLLGIDWESLLEDSDSWLKAGYLGEGEGAWSRLGDLAFLAQKLGQAAKST